MTRRAKQGHDAIIAALTLVVGWVGAVLIRGATMRDTRDRWHLSSMLLAVSGTLLVGVGIYFLFLRPPLLPEDIRYMSLTPAELQSVGPRLMSWLTYVFRVMGGYVAATGMLALTLAATSFRDHRPVAAVGAGVAGGLSIGLMAAVNFMIQSDFKWVLLGMALVWGTSIATFVRESALASRQSRVRNPDLRQ